MIQPLSFVDLRGDRPRPLASLLPRTVLCLGNFDGVHIAHMALLEHGLTLSQHLSVTEEPTQCGVFCFYRPSIDFLPRPALGHLTTLRQKLAIFAEAGMEFACLCDFESVRELPPLAFVDKLKREAGCVGAVCGFNFRFGHKAAGHPEDLAVALGSDHIRTVPNLCVDGETVSASRIRACLKAGKAAEATRLLGRPYCLETTVTHGKQLGRVLGFPTANQYFLTESLIPAHGVYAARCHTPEGVFPGVANVGCRPTVDAHGRVNCETHILGYTGDLYGHRLKVEFLEFLRPEQRFSGVDELTEAIRRDAARAKAYVHANPF